MSTPQRRRLEALIGLGWILALAASVWLWRTFHDPSAVPPSGSPAARLLSLLGSVPYQDPDLVARVRATRIVVLATFFALAALAFLEFERVLRTVVRFFSAESHPLNLAIFRIVLFMQAYKLAWFDYIVQVASLPAGLQVPPATAVPSIGPLAAFAHWPLHVLTPSQVELAGRVMVGACVTGMLGLFSRTSALVMAATFFYGWGAMQWFGKVDHHHHVLWFALVLAASPCGDALSIDSVTRAWRCGRRGATEPPRPDVAYGVPLRMVMLLMGVLYFFPGFWKIWRSGFDWFMGDSALNQIYLKWHMLGGWIPFVRVDLHPWLVHGGALGTVLFELSFVFLIFGRWTRALAAVLGVTFHTALQVFMRHGFESLRNCYVVFVDWHALLRRLGRRLFRHTLWVSFDARDRRAAPLVAVVRALDWLERITWTDEATAHATAHAASDADVIANGLRATIGEQVYSGPRAWAAIAARIPLLWPAAPMLYLLAVFEPAPRDRQESQAARATIAKRGVPANPVRTMRRSAWGAFVVGSVLVLGNAWAGSRRMQDAWPIACYPLFDGLIEDSYTTLEFRVVTADGSQRTVDPHDYVGELGGRWTSMLLRILDENDEALRRRQLRLVWDVLAQHDPALAQSRSIRFFTVRSWIHPDRWRQPPDSPQLIYEVTL